MCELKSLAISQSRDHRTKLDSFFSFAMVSSGNHGGPKGTSSFRPSQNSDSSQKHSNACCDEDCCVHPSLRNNDYVRQAVGGLRRQPQPSVEVMGDIPGELISALIDYRENRIKGSAVMDLLDTWRMSAKAPVPRVER